MNVRDFASLSRRDPSKWVRRFDKNLKETKLDQKTFPQIFLNLCKEEELSYLQSQLGDIKKVNDYEILKTRLLKYYFSVEHVPKFQRSGPCTTLEEYLEGVEKFFNGPVGNEKECLDVLIEDWVENNLVSHRNFKSLRELVSEVKDNYYHLIYDNVNILSTEYSDGKMIVPSLKRREDIISDGSVSIELILKVPCPLWHFIFPQKEFRRKTCLSLLSTCSQLRKHLMPLFYKVNPDQFVDVLEGFYENGNSSIKLTKDMKYCLTRRTFEKSVKSEGSWKIVKKDISNDFYALSTPKKYYIAKMASDFTKSLYCAPFYCLYNLG
eukprot:TRINITY_DN8506_c0_g2_i1.p1 TRINITY_DN8506_c0_g2~~TRINITY_DN8506_c0_g2_i1.p1  ORF type:complete len:334 (-),score=96.13 TRINITY_DN8506_c0_g2_i1:91-1059(-)